MYIVLEIQKSNGNISTLTYDYDDRRDAQAKYHTILAAAAKSGLERHGAIILTENLGTYASETFTTKVQEVEENE